LPKGFFVGSNLVAWARALNISSVQYSQYRSLKVSAHLETAQKMANQDVLVDSGATNNFIDPRLLKQLGIGTIPLPEPKKIWNIDRTLNKAGELTNYTMLNVHTRGWKLPMRFLVTNLGEEWMILGYPWLAAFEPQCNWRDSTISANQLPIIITTQGLQKGEEPRQQIKIGNYDKIPGRMWMGNRRWTIPEVHRNRTPKEDHYGIRTSVESTG
jgi:hypothetical protein